MLDITNSITQELGNNAELMWYRNSYKVILFINDTPVSFINLEDNENTIENAMKAANELANGGGTHLED